MRCRHLVALGLLLLPAPAFACRCRVADTPEKRAVYADNIADLSHMVATGRFETKGRKERVRFLVRKRISGASQKRPWVRRFGPFGGFGDLIYSGTCVNVEPWSDSDKVIVLRRRPDEAEFAPAYEADSCASSFLSDHPDLIAQVARRSSRPRPAPWIVQ